MIGQFFSKFLFGSLVLSGLFVAASFTAKVAPTFFEFLQVRMTDPAQAQQKQLKEPSWTIRFAVFESGIYGFGKDKNSPAGIGYVMEMNARKELRILKTIPATFGSRQGMKEAEGDRKTPHGLYYVIKTREKTDNVNIYGGLFLELNYPNKDDYEQNRTGSGIGIHGGRVLPTRGCIRILDDNWEAGTENIRQFNELTGEKTAILVVRKLRSDLRGKSGAILTESAFKSFYKALTDPNPTRESILKTLEEPVDFFSGT